MPLGQRYSFICDSFYKYTRFSVKSLTYYKMNWVWMYEGVPRLTYIIMYDMVIKRVSENWTNPLKVQLTLVCCKSHIVNIIPADVSVTKALGQLQVWCWLRFDKLLVLLAPHGCQNSVILRKWFKFREPPFYTIRPWDFYEIRANIKLNSYELHTVFVVE